MLNAVDSPHFTSRDPIGSCQRLSNWLNYHLRNESLLTDSNLRVLHGLLPKICSVIFGNKDRRGWAHARIHSRQAEELYGLLRPDGPLMTALLKVATDRRWRYDVNDEGIPQPSQRLLEANDLSSLPAIYKNKIELSEDSTTSTILGTTAAVHRQPNRPKAKVVINMFEYYIFSFAFTVVTGSQTPTYWNKEPKDGNVQADPARQEQVPQNLPKSASSLNIPRLPFVKSASTKGKRSSVSHDTRLMNEVFGWLLDDYLAFFIPSNFSKYQMNGPETRPQHPSNLRTPSRYEGFKRAASSSVERLTSMLHVGVGGTDEPQEQTPSNQRTGVSTGPRHIFNSGPILEDASSAQQGYSAAMNASNFFIGVLAELWLNQNDYSSPSPSTFASPYIIPTTDCLKAILAFAQHISSTDLILLYEQSGGQPQRSSTFENVVLGTRRHAYQTLQSHLYKFLKLAIVNWPTSDESFFHLVNIWLAYITPWKTGSGRMSFEYALNEPMKWAPYISDNLLYYSNILQLFLEKANQFGFDSMELIGTYVTLQDKRIDQYGRVVDPKPKDRSKSELGILKTVIRIFQGELLVLLNLAENTLINSNVNSASTYMVGTPVAGGFPNRANTFLQPYQRYQPDNMLTSAFAGSRHANMHVVPLRESIARLENPAYRYEPFFIAEKEKAKGVVKRLIVLLDRGCYIRSEKSREDTRGNNSTTAAGNTTAAQQQSVSMSNSGSGWLDYLSFVFNLKDTVMETIFGATPKPRSMNKEIIDRETKSLKEVIRNLCDTFGISNEELQVLEVSNAMTISASLRRKAGPEIVYAPETEPDDPIRLSNMGRMQIKKGLRKCPPPQNLHLRPKKIVSTDITESGELYPLVILAHYLGIVFDIVYQFILDLYEKQFGKEVELNWRDFKWEGTLRWCVKFSTIVNFVVVIMIWRILRFFLWLIF
ncbi:hypothetical protein BKA69DRAFT_1083580 [Paraphysoderma sedebokerense]|nr:hypothetical protein BKA69DRAFT_1083580 [Paraphysoderma sedebokerense]